MQKMQTFKIKKLYTLKESMVQEIEGPYGKWIKYPRTPSQDEKDNLRHITEENPIKRLS